MGCFTAFGICTVHADTCSTQGLSFPLSLKVQTLLRLNDQLFMVEVVHHFFPMFHEPDKSEDKLFLIQQITVLLCNITV